MQKKTVDIVKGEDRVLTLTIKDELTEDPYDLTGWTQLVCEFRKSNGQLLQLSSVATGGVAASGIHETVNFTADSTGVVGNGISLVFNGSDDIDTVVSNWNTGNPANTVSHDGTGTAILSATTLNLADGVDAYPRVTVLGAAILGKVQVIVTDIDTNQFRIGKSQNIRLIIDKGDEKRIVLFRSVLNVLKSDV